MYKRIFGNDNYVISLNGKLAKSNGEECTLPVQNNMVQIELFGSLRWLDLEWLSLYAHFETTLLPEYVDRINDIHFQDTVPFFKNPSGSVMVFRRPMVVLRKYRVVPGFTRYAVSADGSILDLKTWKVSKILKPVERGYPSMTIYNPDKSIYHNVYIHRLVALAWVKNFSYVDKPIVNHIDGNKNNFHFKNLEWVSFSENSIHAVNNNLRYDALACKIRDAYTGKINEFDSVRGACIFMGIDPTTPSKNLQHKTRSKLISDKFEFKLKSDTTPWFYEKFKPGTSAGRYTLMLEYPDGKIEEHPDVRKFQKDFKIWNISGIKSVVEKFKTIYSDINISVVDNYKLGEIQAYEIDKGKIIEAASIREMTKLVPLTFAAIRNCLSKDETFSTQGYAFRYKTDKLWDCKFTTYKSTPRCIEATHCKTGEIKIFKSLRETARFFNTDRSVIKMYLQKEWSYRSWNFSEKK